MPLRQCYWADAEQPFLDLRYIRLAARRQSVAERDGAGLINDHGLIIDQSTGEVTGRSPGLVLSHIKERGTANTQFSTYLAVGVGSQDTLVKRKRYHHQTKGGGLRGVVTEFSRASRNRMVLMFRNLVGLRVLLTLTYPAEFPTDGELVKYHLKLLRQWLKRRKVSGCWFIEFQRRGAPHYHLFLDNPVDQAALSKYWYKVVGSGDEKHLRAGTRIEWLRCPTTAAGAYAAKYGSKSEQKIVPDEYLSVGRFWGVFGKLKPAFTWTYLGIETKQGYDVVRIVTKLYKAARRAIGRRAKTGGGTWSFTAWGVGWQALQPYYEPSFSPRVLP